MDSSMASSTSVDIDTAVQSCKEPETGIDCDSKTDVSGDWIDTDGNHYAYYHLKQYAHSVLDFSSQYGIDMSISYTAQNIRGKPSKYPEYGDSPETFAMRTYGDWWTKAPSRLFEIAPQNLPKVPAEDFVVLYFEDFVIPETISIFETFNPGAIVRIWAYTIAKTWTCLWEDTDFYTRPSHTHKFSRCFQPNLKIITLPVNIIRLEFNHQRLDYYTEIDAVLLSGKKIHEKDMKSLLDNYERQKKGSIVNKLKKMKFQTFCIEEKNYEATLQYFLKHDLCKFITIVDDVQVDNDSVNTKDNYETSRVGLKDMPFDVVLNIFSYLDLISLFRVGRVSRFFYEVSTHPLLYRELNLKPFWHLATTELLSTLAKRATVPKKLDMSWCGCSTQPISPTEFKTFIHQRGDTLTHLRLNSAKFLNASCLETIGIVCDNLKELSLRNCYNSPLLLNFSLLVNLRNLERLDLFQTLIEENLLLTILENNPKLKHLNLAYCNVNVNMDEIVLHISKNNKKLVSLDLWKAHFLSANSLIALSECKDLEEVDFGWCFRDVSLGNSLKEFLTNCTKLKKLFLAAARGLTDRDLEYIANLCPNLEQLDLMGIVGIARDTYYEILDKCTKLELLDLSFSDILNHEMTLLSEVYDVKIKCSHLPNVSS